MKIIISKGQALPSKLLTIKSINTSDCYLSMESVECIALAARSQQLQSFQLVVSHSV